MDLAVIVHVLLVGIWIGCIFIAWILEYARHGSVEEHRHLSVIHFRIDKYMEGSAMAGILLSGAYLYLRAPQPILIDVKVVLALIAISINFYCIYCFVMRQNAFMGNQVEVAETYALNQDRVGIPLYLLATMVLGIVAYFRY